MLLPNTGMDAVPFTPLTAEFLDNIVENIEAVNDTGGRLTTINTYTAGATWTKPAGIKFVVVEVVGGGGSGGGSAAGTASNSGLGGGGGGGGYGRKKILAASLGSTETVTVGSGGAAPTAGANNGNTGGTSSFGTHVTATGGTGGGGDAMHTHNIGSAPVAGGIGTNGDINIRGGTSAISISEIANSRGMSSAGGGSYLGAGAEGRRLSGAGSLAGIAGYVYGGGGGGGIAVGSGAAVAGGAGANGIVIVWEYQ